MQTEKSSLTVHSVWLLALSRKKSFGEHLDAGNSEAL
jgi:hypothetical protein